MSHSHLSAGQRWALALPYGWLLFFFVLPFVFVLKISFATPDRTLQPPYTPLLVQQEARVQVEINTAKYQILLTEAGNFFTHWPGEALAKSPYLRSYWNAIRLAFYTTLFTLLIGYPLAYNIARMRESLRPFFLVLVMVPFWTPFLLRIYGWQGLLKNQGVLNNWLASWNEHWGVIDGLNMALASVSHLFGLEDAWQIPLPIPMLYTAFAVVVGMVYNYLPFMVLPLYAHLVKLDPRLLEAAADLGATPWQVFFRITLPLSRAGILAGSLVVFIPAVGEYVIPNLLGGADVIFIGNRLYDDYQTNIDWPKASAVAVLMLVVLLLPIVGLYRLEQRKGA